VGEQGGSDFRRRSVRCRLTQGVDSASRVTYAESIEQCFLEVGRDQEKCFLLTSTALLLVVGLGGVALADNYFPPIYNDYAADRQLE